MLYQYFNLGTESEFQVFLCNTNDFILHYSFVCTKLNDSKYSCVSLKIQLVICHLFAQS